jgi:hypothetical protein
VRGCLPSSTSLIILPAPLPAQRTHYATQSRFSKTLRLLLSLFLVVMTLVRSQRFGIGTFVRSNRARCVPHPYSVALPNPLPPGAVSETYRIAEQNFCFSVGVDVFSPIGTFGLLAATFFAALVIDGVRVPERPLKPFSICLFLHALRIVRWGASWVSHACRDSSWKHSCCKTPPRFRSTTSMAQRVCCTLLAMMALLNVI